VKVCQKGLSLAEQVTISQHGIFCTRLNDRNRTEKEFVIAGKTHTAEQVVNQLQRVGVAML
ncbi:MAG: hypothetical protein ABI142_09080, partial [Bryocella sp.]